MASYFSTKLEGLPQQRSVTLRSDDSPEDRERKLGKIRRMYEGLPACPKCGWRGGDS